MTCISRPRPESLSSSCTSSSRQPSPLIAYSLEPLRNSVRLIVTSAYSIGSAPSPLSIVSCTSARPSGPRVEVPAKMTSSILPPRSVLAPCSPITQASASTTLRLAGSVRADDAGHTRLEGERRRLREGLEPLEGQALQMHGHARRSTEITASTLSRSPAPDARETPGVQGFLSVALTSAVRLR